MAVVNGATEVNSRADAMTVNEPHKTFDTILVLDFG